MAKKRGSGPEPHAHGCRRCRERYEDTCENAKEDSLCTPCRTGSKPWRLLVESRRPKECCTKSSRLVPKLSKYSNERERYRLAGACVWFICATCSRTHPYDPSKFTPKEFEDD